MTVFTFADFLGVELIELQLLVANFLIYKNVTEFISTWNKGRQFTSLIIRLCENDTQNSPAMKVICACTAHHMVGTSLYSNYD